MSLAESDRYGACTCKIMVELGTCCSDDGSLYLGIVMFFVDQSMLWSKRPVWAAAF